MFSKKSVYTLAVLGMLGAMGFGNSLVSTDMAYAADAKKKGVKVLGAYARASMGNMKISAAFMSVINHNNTADKLIGVTSTIADRTELHTHIKEGNIMKMRRIDAIDVPASGYVDLQPGGHHVMLIGLHKPLKSGDKFSLTLKFEKAGEQTVEVTVRKMGEKSHRGSHDGSGAAKAGKMHKMHDGAAKTMPMHKGSH